ncbi:complement C3-like [Paramormyrops kingsleyae]|uniref:complement C3-like n=1 Tax=Paramormyrops kingsleyae TaxID=1676925 RepID=UPI003B977093
MASVYHLQALCLISSFCILQSQFVSQESTRYRPHQGRLFRKLLLGRQRTWEHSLPVLDQNPPPRFVLLAPNLLRTDSDENIYLEANGVSEPLTVTITVEDFPERIIQLLHDTVHLGKDNDYKALKAIQLPSKSFSRESKSNSYVYLTVNFGSHVAEKVLMVSFHSGYIFIQTDKPVFNPGDILNYRAYVANPEFRAVNSSVAIEIQNPDGLVIHGVSRSVARNGIFSENYRLPDIVSEGVWKILAKFDSWPQNQFSSEFEVKKYVLPAFNVTLTPNKPYFSVDDSELEVEVTASYLYGEPVKGTAYVVFGVEVNKEKRRLPHSLKLIENLEKGMAVLKMSDIQKTFPNIKELVGCPIYVKASVLTSTGSDLVEAERSGIKIVESPYQISFKDTSKFFKPGLPFDLMVQVTHHDGSPAPNVPFKLTLNSDTVAISSHRGVSEVSLNMPPNPQLQTITAETTKSDLKAEHQAKRQLVVWPYTPFNTMSQNYLYISGGARQVSVGARLNMEVHMRNSVESHKDLIKHFTYLVLNKGKIVVADHMPRSGQLVTSIPLVVTPEMMPSFRFVAFYILPWVGTSEVVADSVWVDVVDRCVGTLKITEAEGGNEPIYQPGKPFKFEIRGDPGTSVSLLAVDNAVFLLNNQNRLSQSKIWNVVERGDIGCTQGGGQDSQGVFSDAGLTFHSNNVRVTDTRQGVKCAKSSRRRRSVRILQNKSTLEDQYKDRTLRRCCQDGMREIPMDYSCARRSRYVTEGFECVQAFLHCCSQYRGEELDSHTSRPTITEPATGFAISRHVPFMQSPVRTMARKFMLQSMPSVQSRSEQVVKQNEEEEEEEEADVIKERDVYVRSKFFETWLWNEITLPHSPASGHGDGLASHTVMSALPDSITKWGILAIGSSPTKGFCVADPYNIVARKDFFVDLRLPYSVARNEQVEVKAVIHNYNDQDMEVIVILYKTTDICSVAFTEDHRQEVSVRAQSSRAIPYTIIPLKAGQQELEIKVLGRGFTGHDGVRKRLRVVLEGVQKTKVQSFVLNPSLQGDKDGKQLVKISNIKLDSVVPNSIPETYINVRGSVIADTIDNSISDDSLASLLRMPGGCVEQNLASITLPLIATHYLDRAQQWESVGVQRRLEAVTYIKKGYEKQLAYAKKDNSYPPYRNEGTSTWITAYVVKVFSMTYPIVSINQEHLCGPLLYLLKQKQQLDGSFKEDNPVYAAAMTGGIQGVESTATLTAFVLIAMSEAKAVVDCHEPGLSTENQMRKSVSYLRNQLPRLSRPYSVAIAAYALALMGEDRDFLRDHMQRVASTDLTHWPDSDNSLFTLEATGYALLAHVKTGEMERAGPIFHWLNGRRKQGGGYGSTQPTMVVLQSLSNYLIQKPPPQDLSLNVALSIHGRRDTTWSFTPKTAYQARSTKTNINQEFTVEASGKGQGILEIVTIYNELPDDQDKKSCKNFELQVSIEEISDGKPSPDNERSYRLDINVRALGQDEVRMTVLDITLPTGFVPETRDLETLTNSVDRYINNYEIVDSLSDRGSLIIHLFKVSNTQSETISFRLLQKFNVGLIQPSSVTVYEYYNPEHRCMKFYSPLGEKAELQQICGEETCRCAEGDCCVSKKRDKSLTSFMRHDVACDGLKYVYKVGVSKISRGQYDRYEVEIKNVIKEGTHTGIQAPGKIIFLSHAGCRNGLDLQEGRDYLIIGPPEDVWHQDGDTSSFTYVLGKRTWVELWPTEAECQSDASLQETRSQMEEFATSILENGCQF